MQRIKFSEDIKPISDLRAKGAKIINQVKTTKRPILITQRGRGVAVLLEISEKDFKIHKNWKRYVDYVFGYPFYRKFGT